MRIYSIKDWAKYYEVSDSRKVDGPLTWVAVRTKQDGFGFRRIASERDRCELFAAWMLIVQVAARQPREDRGKLIRAGRPLDAKSLALMTGFPAQVFDRALAFFSEPEQDWLFAEEIPNQQPASAASARAEGAPDCASLIPDESEPVRTGPDKSEPIPPTGQDRTGQDIPPLPPSGGQGAGLVKTKDIYQTRAEALFRRRPTTPMSAAEARAWTKARAVVADTDEPSWQLLEWWYALPVERAPYRKTDFAALLNNWHAEIEKARRNRGISRSQRVEDLAEPEGWRAYWRETYPPEEFPDAPRYDEGDWTQVRNDHKREIREGMRKRGMRP